MATRTEVVLVCDVCKSEDGIETFGLVVDKKKAMEFEACPRCAERTPIAKLRTVARMPRQRRRRQSLSA